MESLKVSGVDCGHCAASVKSALEGVAGICSIDIRLEEKSAIVEFDPVKIAKDDVVNRIEDVGFDVE